jgi:hypothetical protein
MCYSITGAIPVERIAFFLLFMGYLIESLLSKFTYNKCVFYWVFCIKKAFVLGTKALLLSFNFQLTYNHSKNRQNRASDNIQSVNLSSSKFRPD